MDVDSLLIQKMLLGNEAAIETFVLKYYPIIFQYCQFQISDYGYAEDTTQETFIRFFRTLPEYRHCGKALNYLYTIAANLCKDYYRKNRETPTENLPEGLDFSTENIEWQIDVQIALEQLPEELREVAVLFFLQEQKQKDIARILGIGVPLVKYRIRKIRELFSAYFQRK